MSQPLTGHAGAFATIKILGRDDPAQVLVFHEKKPEPQEGPKLFVMEVGRDPAKGAGFRLAPTPIPLAPDAAADFPVSLCVDQKDDLAFLMTKISYIYMFDTHTRVHS